MTQDGWKALVGMVLLGVWVGLVVAQVPHAEDIISGIKMSLTGLATHYLTTFSPQQTTATDGPAAPPPNKVA
jgi:hypothetical protein